MAKLFHLTIASATQTEYDGLATSVSLPGEAGDFQVLAHHEPLITTLRSGRITYSTESGTSHTLDIAGGAVEVVENRCTILL